MSKAIQATSTFAFQELNLKKLQIISHESNIASIKVAEKCSFITPVPGGIGPMTIASLMMNTLKALELQGK